MNLKRSLSFLFLAGILWLLVFVPNPAAAQIKKVDVYLTSWCPYCRKAEDFLKEKNISYDRHDIERDSEARTAYRKLGGRGVPLIRVGDRIIYGYDKGQIAAALE